MLRILVMLGLALMLAACSDATPNVTTTWEETLTGEPPSTERLAAKSPRIQTLDNPGKLSDLELTAEAPELPAAPPTFKPVPVAQAKSVKLHILSENGYLNDRRKYVVDLLERDMAYLTVKVETAEGNPVQGATPTFETRGSSKITPMSDSPITDDSGMVEFGLMGGKMGEDFVTVSVGDARLEMLVNVISLKAMGFPKLDEVKGALRWDELMQARLRFNDNTVHADFPAPIAAQHNKTVKLVGFMMPLEAEQKQKHFLLTSNPPSCFFHIPGGPAGAVEVFAEKGIEASWDPIILEGRFETVSGNEMGVIYRLRKARVVSK